MRTICLAASALVVGVFLSGCATEIHSRIYDLKEGKVLPATFTWKGGLSGPAKVMRGEEACEGEYQTIQEGRTITTGGTAVGSWGTIFGSLYSTTSVERAQRGAAVAICPSGVTFECEYVANASLSGPTGHGACKDNRGGTYRLMFSPT